MKTKFQLEKLIAQQRQILETEAVTKKGKVTIHNKIEFLNTCLLYIETNPRPEFVQSEIERITAILNSIKAECEKFKSKTSIANYKSLKGYTFLNKQLKTLNFISCQ